MIKKNEDQKPAERPRIKPPEIHRRPTPMAMGTGSAAVRPSMAARPAQAPHQMPASPREQHGDRPRGPRSNSMRAMGPRPGAINATNSKLGPKPLIARDPNEKSNPEAVRLVPLGGLEEVGRNCSFLEYKNEIAIIDMGLQFPEEETPGIDYIIPNVDYLEKKKQNIAAIILTHGHYDHIGALPHVLARLGNPPIYATSITKAIIEKRADDFPNAPKMNIKIIKEGDEIKLSNNFTALFFGVPHTIPETTGVMMKTPIGNIVHFADFRLDYDDEGNPHGLEEFE